MPNIRSAAKRARTSAKRRMYNRAIKSEVRTLVKRFDEAVQGGEKEAASERFPRRQGARPGSRKGVVHKNLAARKKSRMATSRLRPLIGQIATSSWKATQAGSKIAVPFRMRDEPHL